MHYFSAQLFNPTIYHFCCCYKTIAGHRLQYITVVKWKVNMTFIAVIYNIVLLPESIEKIARLEAEVKENMRPWQV